MYIQYIYLYSVCLLYTIILACHGAEGAAGTQLHHAAGQVSEVAARFIFLWLRALAMNRGRGSGAGVLLPRMIWRPLYISQSFFIPYWKPERSRTPDGNIAHRSA